MNWIAWRINMIRDDDNNNNEISITSRENNENQTQKVRREHWRMISQWVEGASVRNTWPLFSIHFFVPSILLFHFNSFPFILDYFTAKLILIRLNAIKLTKTTVFLALIITIWPCFDLGSTLCHVYTPCVCVCVISANHLIIKHHPLSTPHSLTHAAKKLISFFFFFLGLSMKIGVVKVEIRSRNKRRRFIAVKVAALFPRCLIG